MHWFQETFQGVEQWISDVHQCVGDVKMVLVGNKCDLSHQQVVSSASGKVSAPQRDHYTIVTSIIEVKIVMHIHVKNVLVAIPYTSTFCIDYAWISSSILFYDVAIL